MAISYNPVYCECAGSGSTHANWVLTGPVKKVRKRKLPTKTRMIVER
jgi:hypothetical protein